MEQRRRNIRRTKTNRPDPSTGSDCATPAAGNTLDGSLLIRLHCVENPSDLCSIDISEQRLTSVKNEDCKEFDNIVYINASDNFLSIESFRSFSLLRELDLSLNGCCDMKFNSEDFPHLEVLDLSYNNLSEADIVCIGQIAGLKVLRLTGNRLHQLPSNHHPTLPTPTDKEKPRFGALEVLTLEDNRLSSDVFHSLAHFPRLQHLNLQGNNISEIPFMLPDGDGAQTGSNRGHFLGISQPTVGVVESSLPLPQLQFLSLAHNKIAEEEALLAAALFPNLTELLIHNNPLTTRRTGDPPLLTYLLSVRRGVKVKRTDAPEVEKPSVMLPALTHKVRNNGKVLKRPSLTERPRGSLQETESQDVPKNQRSSGAKNGLRDGVTAGAEETNQQAESFFFTQPGDLCDEEFKRDATENAKKTKENNRHSFAFSEKFKNYDILMNMNSKTADVVVATGIQTSVRMLEQTLKSVIVCRDVRTTPNRRQPHPSTEKRSTKMRGEKDEDLKRNPTIRSSISDGQQVNREAVSLLKEMCRNYKTTARTEQENII